MHKIPCYVNWKAKIPSLQLAQWNWQIVERQRTFQCEREICFEKAKYFYGSVGLLIVQLVWCQGDTKWSLNRETNRELTKVIQGLVQYKNSKDFT